jgi:hypothetical protein
MAKSSGNSIAPRVTRQRLATIKEIPFIIVASTLRFFDSFLQSDLT